MSRYLFYSDTKDIVAHREERQEACVVEGQHLKHALNASDGGNRAVLYTQFDIDALHQTEPEDVPNSHHYFFILKSMV